MVEREVSYSNQTLNAANPIARFVHRRRHAIGLKLVGNAASHAATVLDFGCGEGDFLQELNLRRPDLSLYGCDPYSGHIPRGYESANDLTRIAAGSVDIVCAFETLEHLYEQELEEFYKSAKRLLRKGGVAIISVPIIGGPTLLVKEANRAFMFRRPTDYSVQELFRASLLGIPAQRANVRTSHKGFDYSGLRRRLRNELKETRTFYSPFSWFPWFLNSQMFWIGSRT